MSQRRRGGADGGIVCGSPELVVLMENVRRGVECGVGVIVGPFMWCIRSSTSTT
jgi:hypothetical protein